MDADRAAGATPQLRVMALPRWTRDGDRLLVDDAETGHPQSWNLWTGAVLDGLAAGEAYPQLVERVRAHWPDGRPRHHEKTLRRFLFTLHRLKAIEILHRTPSEFAGGRYQTVRELGRGGVGIAWLARERDTGRELVVKRAWDYFAPIEKADALLRAEMDVMRRIDHPRVARAHDAFEENGLLHLVRGFAPGEELSRWRTTGVQPRAARVQLARDIAEVIAHLHERGLILLDLRPANFFVEPQTMTPMLIDVGHCKPLERGVVDLGLPKKGKAHGSPGFAAPETFEGAATPRTDVWGFGRLYSFMTTGQLPRSGQTTANLTERMREAGADTRDTEIVAKCAADTVTARPPTMREVIALLE